MRRRKLGHEAHGERSGKPIAKKGRGATAFERALAGRVRGQTPVGQFRQARSSSLRSLAAQFTGEIILLPRELWPPPAEERVGDRNGHREDQPP